MNVRRRPRWLPRWRDLLLAMLALVAIVVLRNAEPAYNERLLPIVLDGGVEQRIQARNFAVEAKRPKLAHAYLVDGGAPAPAPRRVATAGIWLSVVADVEALRVPGLVGARIRTRDGLLYQGNQDRPATAVNFIGKTLDPGLPVTGAWFFELPPGQVEGARLQLFWGPYDGLGGIDHLVDIDLGLDATRTRQLLDEAPAALDLRG